MAAWLLLFCVAMCVERCGFGSWCCKTHCNRCMDVAWASFWEKAGAGNRAFFCLKWLRPAMKGTSCVRRVRLGSNWARLVPPLCSATSGCSCVRDSIRFLNVWLQMAGYNGCMIVVVLCCHVSRDAGLDFDVAKRIVMAAWMLHGLRFGRKPGQETVRFSVYSGSSRRWKVPRVCGGCGWVRDSTCSFLVINFFKRTHSMVPNWGFLDQGYRQSSSILDLDCPL